MDCERAIALVEKLVDGEAGPAEKRDAEAHLSACASCREHHRFLTAVGTHYRASDLLEPPESYWEHLPRKIQKRIDSEQAVRGRGLFERFLSPAVLRLGALTATLGVLLVVGVSVLRDDPLKRAEEASSESSLPEPSPPQVGVVDDSRETPVAAAAPPAAPKPSPRVEEIESEALDSLRSVGHIAEAEEKRAEVAAPPAELAAPTRPASSPSAEGLESAFADVAGVAEGERADDKLEARESFSQLESQNEESATSENTPLARARAVEDCERYREMVEGRAGEDARAVDLRYELARCSIRGLQADDSDERRAVAIADGEAFLALEAEGTRAEEIREALKTTIRR